MLRPHEDPQSKCTPARAWERLQATLLTARQRDAPA